VADELGTAVLRIVADDSAARESLNVLRRDVEQLTTRATRAASRTTQAAPRTGGAGGGGGTAPDTITRQDVRRFNLRGLNAALDDVNQDIAALRVGRRLNISSSWNKFLTQLEETQRDIERAAQTEGRRIGRLNVSPVRGGAAFPGSPAFLDRALPPLPANYFGDLKRRADAQAKRQSNIISNALIGGAFPLLFGQGVGAAVGGAAGGAAGGAIGGQFGFGLSLVGTAVGSQLDLAAQKLGALGQAINDPVKQFAVLQQNASLSSKELERYVGSLIAVGRGAEAAATIQEDLIKTYGSLQAAEAYNNQIDELNRSWSRASVILASFVIGPLAGFLNSLTNTGTRIGTAARFEQLAQALDPEQLSRVRKRTDTATRQAREARATAQGGVAGALTQFLPPSEGDVAAGRRAGIQLAEQLLGVEKQREEAAARIAAAQILTTEAFSNQFRAIDAQTQGYERQALLLQKQVALNERNRQLLELPENLRTGSPEALKIQQEAALSIYRISAQILTLDRQRAATSVLQAANYRKEAQELDRQFAAAKRIADIPTPEGISIARDSASQIEDIKERAARARAKEVSLANELFAEQIRGGGDASAERILQIQLQQVNAARETRNILSQGATELTEAGKQLARDLRSAVLEFTNVRSDPQGLNRFLSPELQGRRAQQDFERLLPRFRQAQARFFQLTGQRAPDFSGPTSGVNEALRDFINAVDREFSATEALNQTTSALNDTSNALVIANLRLAEVTAALAAKDWNVAVNVQGGDFNVLGDANNRALS
jgi:hypothetical protein